MAFPDWVREFAKRAFQAEADKGWNDSIMKFDDIETIRHPVDSQHMPVIGPMLVLEDKSVTDNLQAFYKLD
jgi:hypothetical protein